MDGRQAAPEGCEPWTASIKHGEIRDSLEIRTFQRRGEKEQQSGLFPLGPDVLLPLSAAGEIGVEPLVAQGRVEDGCVEIVQIETSTWDLHGCKGARITAPRTAGP